jgi:hypothetical protein
LARTAVVVDQILIFRSVFAVISMVSCFRQENDLVECFAKSAPVSRTNTLRQNLPAKNGGFCQGQKRPIFVPNCKHNEPTGDIQACHSKPSLFAGAASCSAHTGHSRADTMLRRSPSERPFVHRAAFFWMKRRSADKAAVLV